MLSDATFPIDEALLEKLGTLIGLISKSGSNYQLNLDWFQDPLTALQQIPTDGTKRHILAGFLGELLGTSQTSPLGGNWYLFPGSPSKNVFLLIEETKPSSGTDTSLVLGVGMQKEFDFSQVKVTPSLQIPLVTMQDTGVSYFWENGEALVQLDMILTSKTFSYTEPSNKTVVCKGARVNLTFTESHSWKPSVDFFFLPQSGDPILITLEELEQQSGLSAVNTVLGAMSDWLNYKIAGTAITPGGILTTWNVLKASGDPATYTYNNLKNITSIHFAQFLSPFLKGLKGVTLVTFGQGQYQGALKVASQTVSKGTTAYGLQLTVPNIDLPATASIQPTLQLGADMIGDDDSQKWTGSSIAPGIYLFLITLSDSDSVDFAPELDLISVGINLTGKPTTDNKPQPVFNHSGFTFNSVNPRLYAKLTTQSTNKVILGAGLGVDQFTIPINATVNSSSDSNPPVQSLIKGSTGDQSSQPSANKPFSFAVAYSPDATPHAFNGFLYNDKNIIVTNPIWLTVQRAFGPLQIQQYGVGWNDKSRTVEFAIDASVNLSALEMVFQGLAVHIHAQDPLQGTTLSLSGFDVSLHEPSLDLSGAFLEDTTGQSVGYAGDVLIKGGPFSIEALGFFGDDSQGNTSLFIFGMLDAPLGGPPFFFVTGVAAGFGYNQQLSLPSLDKVAQFPLVQGASSDSSPFSGNDPKKALQQLETVIQPENGEDWFAAGVQFTSFEMIHSFALVTAEFGTQFEVAVLGLSAASFPKGASDPIAYVQMGLEASLDPAKGLLAIGAELTPQSYIFSTSCRLTGGFAFYTWFSGEHAGNFVVTLGGYSPYFQVPDFYPQVPRLGLNWKISDDLQVVGGVYFALTPSAFMAGGSISATFHTGPIKAWFDAELNFLIEWEPFMYRAQVGVNIGVSVTLDFLFVHTTITISVGVDANFWGPAFGGTAKIDLYIVSFTIPFGSSSPPKPPDLDWTEFENAFLPSSHAAPQANLARANSSSGNTTTLVSVQATGGVLKNLTTVSASTSGTFHPVWVIAPQTFALQTTSVFPTTEAYYNPPHAGDAVDASTPQDDNGNLVPLAANTNVGVGPMGIVNGSLRSTQTVTLTREGTPYPASDVILIPIMGNVPKALWSQSKTPDTSSQTTLSNVVTGFQILPPSPQADHTFSVPVSVLLFDPQTETVATWGEIDIVDVIEDSKQAFDDLSQIASNANRSGILDALSQYGLPTRTEVNLDQFAKEASSILLSAPALASLQPESST